MNGINKQRLYILIAAAIGVISTFLPWAKVSLLGFSQSVSGLEAGGWITLLLYGGAGVLAVLGDRNELMTKKNRTIVLILSGLGALFSLIKIIQISSEDLISLSFGVLLALLAGLALVAIYFVVKGDGSIDVKNIEKPDFLNKVGDMAKNVTTGAVEDVVEDAVEDAVDDTVDEVTK